MEGEPKNVSLFHVKTHDPDGTFVSERLIWATQAISARNFVAKEIITVERVTQNNLILLTKCNVEPEHIPPKIKKEED